MGTAVAIQDKARDLAAYFEAGKDKFEAFMPADQVPRFMRVMNNAILKDPEIANASKQSVFLECQKAASDGLVLDGREATLTRFKSNKRQQVNGKWEDNWQTEVVYIPMIRGLTKLVNASPEVLSWNTALVYQNEYEQGRFDYEAGVTPKLFHKPIVVGERGPVVAAYSVVRLRSGVVSVEVMTRAQLDSIKARTKSKKRRKVNNQEVEEITGPWATDEEEMQRKTVARRHFKNLPLEGKAADAMQRVDSLYDFDASALPEPSDAPQIAPPPVPKAVANKKNGSAKAKLAAAAKKPEQEKPAEEETPHDPDTGEVLEGEIVDDDPNAVDPEDDF